VLSPFRGGGIAYLIDPDSYADWRFYTPGRASQVFTFLFFFPLFFYYSAN